VSLHQRQFVGPQLMNDLQEIFDLAWQEISAQPDIDLDEVIATQLRSELAKTIMSSRSLDPATIRETVLQEIRTCKLNRPGHAAEF
jgi:hypothetical protein